MIKCIEKCNKKRASAYNTGYPKMVGVNVCFKITRGMSDARMGHRFSVVWGQFMVR